MPFAAKLSIVSLSDRKSVLQPTIMYGTRGQYCFISGTHFINENEKAGRMWESGDKVEIDPLL